MNERIKELAEQAGFYVAMFDPGNKDNEAIEKFAELIVKECISVGRTAFLNDNSKLPVFPTKPIKQHFGVEE